MPKGSFLGNLNLSRGLGPPALMQEGFQANTLDFFVPDIHLCLPSIPLQGHAQGLLGAGGLL